MPEIARLYGMIIRMFMEGATEHNRQINLKPMKHLIVKVKSVTVPELYKIKVIFDDATERTIDLEYLLAGPMYGPLKDPEIFKGVTVDPDAATVVWPNGADYDPETLYKWNLHEHELKDRALHWHPSH